MAKWGEIKYPRCEELKGKLNYAVGEWEDYEKIIKQMQAEWLANKVAILRLEAELKKAVEALRQSLDSLKFSQAELKAQAHIPEEDFDMLHSRIALVQATLAELTGGQKDE